MRLGAVNKTKVNGQIQFQMVQTLSPDGNWVQTYKIWKLRINRLCMKSWNDSGLMYLAIVNDLEITQEPWCRMTARPPENNLGVI